MALVQAALLAAGCGSSPFDGLDVAGDDADDADDDGDRSDGTGIAASTSAPTSASATPDPGAQAAFPSPVNNRGALVHQIPFELPEAFRGMKPELALTYDSQGGVGLAGVGWDVRMPMIALDLGEGHRPRSIADDLGRVVNNTPIDRYTSHLGTITVTADSSGWTYLFDPTNDLRVLPIADDSGAAYINGDVAAWEVTAPDGTRYRFGTTRQSSLWEDEGLTGRRKVAWLLEEVIDPVGHRMRYYWEEYPARQTALRQPTLRAIEYGNVGGTVPRSLVVAIDHTDARWRRSTHSLGTRTDQAYVIDKLCVHPDASVQRVPGSAKIWWDVISQRGPMTCYDLTYQFQDGGVASYTGRPLLTAVERYLGTSRLPGWRFAYSHQGENWYQAYRNAVHTPVVGQTTWNHSLPEANLPLSTVSGDITQLMADLDGDGVLDALRGDASGALPVFLARDGTDADSLVDSHATTDWNHPLASAQPMVLTGSLTAAPESSGSDCWHNFEASLSWSGTGSGLGYTRALTAAPSPYDDAYNIAGANDEAEATYLDLGAFRFLSNSYHAPAPRSFNEAPLNRAETIDEYEVYGSFKDRKKDEVGFDLRTSDCQDAGDHLDIDHCWEAGTGASGLVGEELGCLDYAGGRWFTQDSAFSGYASQLWDLMDINGDGRHDWVMAANVIQRSAAGVMHDHAAGDNDWYVAFGNGGGWDPPVYWSMPTKEPALSGVDFVHGTGQLATNVSSSSALRDTREIGVNVCPGPTGVTVAPIIGGLPTSVGSAVAAGVSTGLERAVGTRATANLMTGIGTMATAYSLANGGGICIGLTNKGVSLPIVGNVFTHLIGDHQELLDATYQGTADLDGDGRPDYVTARYDAGSTLNDSASWLFYHNDGRGFDDPIVWKFPAAPEHPASNSIHRTYVTSMQSTRTQQVTKVRWFVEDSFEPANYAIRSQSTGLVDLNGDGLLDMVSTLWAKYYGGPTNGDGLFWRVWFNEGDGFSQPYDWEFEGGWKATGCSSLHAHPALSQTATYVDTGIGVRDMYSRQVMGMHDVNRDGLIDFWYQEPYDGERGWGIGDGDGKCGYLPEWGSITSNSRNEWISYTEPQALKNRLMVRLNKGTRFGAATEWIDAAAFPLGGAYGALYEGSGNDIDSETAYASQAVTDMNADGVPELALAERTMPDATGVTSYRLLKLAEGNPDRLTRMHTPEGGSAEVTYRYHIEPGGDADGGRWVVGSMLERDVDVNLADTVPGPQLSRRTYEYEHGVFDREVRRFMGFERVYESTDGHGGYTVSRYLQDDGFDGLLYCREVRKLDGNMAYVLGQRIDTKNLAWASGTPAGYARATVIGDAGKSSAPIGPRLAPSDEVTSAAESERDQGDVSDAAGWGLATGPVAAESASADAAEAERYPGMESTYAADNVAGGYQPVAQYYPGGEPLPNGQPMSVDTPGPRAKSTAVGYARSSTDVASSLYGTCTTTGSGDNRANFTCNEETALEAVACADAGDPGIPVQTEYRLWADHSTRPGLVTPRLVERRGHLWNTTGADARTTSVTYTYDQHGNVEVQGDRGDVADPADDLNITRRFAINAAAGIVATACHEQVKDASGAIVGETWNDYDGAAAASCTAPTRGLGTSVRRRVDAASTATWTTTHNADGLVASTTDARGGVTQFTYHATFRWLPATETRTAQVAVAATPTGTPTLATETHVTTMRYHGADTATWRNFGQVASVTDINGKVVERTYDAFGRPLTELLPGDTAALPARSWRYETTTGPRHVHVERRKLDTRYVETATELDGFARVHRVTGTAPSNDHGATKVVSDRRTYDAAGRVTRQWFPMFDVAGAVELTVDTAYDVLGRPSRRAFPNGGSETWAYDRERVTHADAAGEIEYVELDARNRETLRAEYDAQGATLYRTTRYTFRPEGPLRQILDEAGNQWTFDHDMLGNETARVDPDSGRRVTLRDKHGNVTIEHDARYASAVVADRLATRTIYDDLDRPRMRTEYSSAAVSGSSVSGTIEARTVWYHDRDPGTLTGAKITCATPSTARGQIGRIDHWQRQGGPLVLASQKERCHDERGRLVREAITVRGTTYVWNRTYNALGDVVTVTYPDGDVVTTTYDNAGKPLTVTSTAGTVVADVAYNAFGLVEERMLGASAVRERICYEKGGSAGLVPHRVVAGKPALSVTCDASLTSYLADTVNDGGFPARVLRDVAYGRDDLMRVTTAQERRHDPATSALVSHTTDFGYDARGRLTDEQHDGTAATYGYDVQDNLIDLDGRAQTYGATSCTACAGGPHALDLTDAGHQLRYDVAGNVHRVDTPAGNRYDLTWNQGNQPRRINRSGTAGTAVATFLYDDTGARVERNDPSGVTTYAGDVRVGPARTESFYGTTAVKVREGGADALYFRLGDPVSSLDLLVDASGKVVQHTRFTPFGELREQRVHDPVPADGLTPYASPDRFGGQEREGIFAADDEVYDFGARLYLASVGRWLSADPVLESGLDRYAFSRNDPVNWTDPDGRTPAHVLGAWVVAETVFTLYSIGDGMSVVVNPNAHWALRGMAGMGVVADAGSLVIPGVPGGAGASVSWARRITLKFLAAAPGFTDRMKYAVRVLDQARSAYAQQKNPIALTLGVSESDGMLMFLSQRSGTPSAEEVRVVQDMFPEVNVVGVIDEKEVLPAALKHAEARGVDAADVEGLTATVQACSHAACGGCTAMQDGCGIIRLTPSAAQNGGKIMIKR